MQTSKRILLAILCLLTVEKTSAQQAEMPFIRNFSSSEFNAYQQNVCIAQDQRGVMYFGNYDGVLEFDGINWHLIKVTGVRSIAIDSAGIIFVGTATDLGYLQSDNLGNLQFCSLKEKIPESHRNINSGRDIFIIGKQVVFQTDDGLFIYKKGQFKVIINQNFSRPPIDVNNHFYIHERGKGLFCLQNDSLLFIEESECLANLNVITMLPYSKNEILVFTYKGFFIYAPDSPVKFYKPDGFNEVKDYLLKNRCATASKLPNGDFAVGTNNNGILFFDGKGAIKKLYNKSNGLQDNTVWQLFVDQNQQLWAVLENGISLIQTNIPFKQYTSQNGLIGKPMCVDFFNNQLYVGTSQYLHIQNQQGNFEIIEGTGGRNQQLYIVKGSLLLAHANGLFDVKGKQTNLIMNSGGLTFIGFCPLKNHPDYLLVSSFSGLYLLGYKNSAWELQYKIKGFSETAYFCAEDNQSNIWVLSSRAFYRLRINTQLDSVISSQQYTTQDGLPFNYPMPISLNNGEVVFSTYNGIYQYIADKDCFELHPDFGMLKGLVSFKQERNGDMLFDELKENGNTERGILKYKSKKYIPYKTAFYKFNNIRSTQRPYNFCIASDSSEFFGTSEGLLQYNPLQKVSFNLPFHTLIRKVFAKDSLLFGGKTLALTNFEKIEGKEILFSHNHVIFRYAATFYEDAEKNLYSYRLIGSDTTWSAWSSEPKKDYNYLYEGDYIFEVKSMNQYKTIGSIASYSFSILPPVYRTWWAYALYAILSMLFILFIIKIYTRRLVKQKEHLEEVVKVRTLEVTEKNEKLSLQNEEILAQSEEIVSQRDTLSKQNAKIISSITYAKRIQEAVLPSHEIIKEDLPDYFVLYKPRDIVSGDFYWFKKVKNLVYFVTADCTGHGVPGALMSMLGITLLNEIVSESTCYRAGEILNNLRNKLKTVLHQQGIGTEQKDGMDIALCIYNFENYTLQYAGAHNSLYQVRNNELIEYRANRQPCAIHIKESDFTTHEIKIQKNDIIYTFSDGYGDQIGGEDGRKYLAKNLRKFLLTICNEPMEKQRELLDADIETWMNCSEQIDDIIVVGVKIC